MKRLLSTYYIQALLEILKGTGTLFALEDIYLAQRSNSLNNKKKCYDYIYEQSYFTWAYLDAMGRLTKNVKIMSFNATMLIQTFYISHFTF